MKNIFLFVALIGFVSGIANAQEILSADNSKTKLEWLGEKVTGVWFYSNITIDRTQYNIRYGSGSFFDNLGDKVIYDEFKLKVALFLKQ